RHVRTQIIFPLFTPYTSPTRYAGLHCDTVALFEGGDFFSDIDHDASGLVAKNHWLFNDEVSDAAMEPVMHIRAANAGVSDADKDVIWVGGKGRDGPVLKGDSVGRLKDEGEILQTEVRGQ